MEYGLVALWLGLFLALGALAVPASSLLFRKVADRGAGLAIPLSLATLAVLGFWIGRVRFGRVTAVLAIGVLALVSGVALNRGVSCRWDRYRDAALVFTLAFGFLIAIRAFDPAAHPAGGEKFLDLGLLSSLLRTARLPPEDMWFANEPVQYYYGGHMLAAMLAEFAGTTAEYAYNLALAGFYAAYVTAAWAVGGIVSAGRGRSYRRGGAVAAFLVAMASNVSTPIRLLVWALPDGMDRWLADLVEIEMRGLANGPGEFHYWFASRVLEAGQSGDGGLTLITEFPFFAFLNGDLHAHMMSPVFLLLGVGLVYEYWRTDAGDKLRRALLLFGAIPPVVGLLVIVNTWSAPTILGVTWLGLLFAPATPWGLLPGRLEAGFDRLDGRGPIGTEIGRLLVATGGAALVAGLGALWVAPFLTGTATGRSLGFLPEATSHLAGLLVVHGAFLAITIWYFARNRDRQLVAILGLLLVTSIGGASVLGVPGIGLFLPLLLVSWYLLRTDRNVDFETALVLGVLGLLVLVELVYVVEKAGPGRLNTTFKVYAQIWALWSVAAGAMVVELPPLRSAVARIRASIPGDAAGSESDAGSATASEGPETSISWKSTIGSILLVLLFASMSIYAVFGVATTIGANPGPATLDATAFVADDHPKEHAAIEWVDDLSGQPTMVSAPGTDIYQWVNAPSSLTGVPTVAGWSHEVGYRGSDDYRSRVRDVDAIYEATDGETRSVLLERHDVEYIYVGPVERARYEVIEFDEQTGVSVAYEDEWVTIYRVEPSASGD